MSKRVRLLVGTKKGAFILDSDEARTDWSIKGPLCEAWPVHDMIMEPDTGAILVAAGNAWYGPAVWRSEDGGENWTHSSAGMTYGDEAEPVKTIWSLATTPDGGILAGVEPAGLFRSDDRGKTWQHVEGLTNHPSRPTWGPGAGGLILHTIVPHPTDTDRTWVGISAVGVFETRDGGTSWEARNVGVRLGYDPGGPIPETGYCVHKFAMAAGEPDTLYQRNHNGVYRSDDGSQTWQEITGALPTDFGFSMVSHPRDPATCWVIPLSTPEEGRFMPDGHTAVWRTHDRGTSWIRSDDGLPTHDAYMSVLREAMARDTLDPVGITFGTATGQVWHSSDEGVSWRMITDTLPEIWAVEAAVLD
ncbi:MAG TPA: sialidase family protein [Candidatus Limnocylindrales bacterium]|nr:sialidase family protein [Candidatus Limnocylindrales bacterium]